MNIKRTMIPGWLLLTAASFILAVGCGPDRTATESGAEYGNQATDAAVLTPEERADRREELSARMQNLRDRLQDLRQTTDADGVENEWDETVAKIDREAADLRRQLDEFGDDSRDAWTEFETRVQHSLDSIGQEIDETVAKAKS